MAKKQSSEEAPKKAIKPIKLPKNSGLCADRMLEIEEELAALKKAITAAGLSMAARMEKLQAEYNQIESHLIETLPKTDMEGVVGKKAHAVIKTSKLPTLNDWAAFTAHVRKTGDFSLLNKSMSIAAIREQWAAKKKVPGVGVFNRVSVNVTSRK